jgi:hypothetical protein
MTDTVDQRPKSGWTAGRVVAMVFASIGGLIGLALLAGGVAALSAWTTERDDDGYFHTDRERITSAAYAVTTEDIDLGKDEVVWAPEGVLGNVGIRVEGDQPVFVGFARDADVERYIGGVAHDELVDFDDDRARYESHQGRAPRTPPAEQTFWEAQSEGSGEQSLTWDADFGRWTVVVMNADAARGVDVGADVGVKLDWALWVGVGLFFVGLVMTAGAVAVILLVGRRADRMTAPTT